MDRQNEMPRPMNPSVGVLDDLTTQKNIVLALNALNTILSGLNTAGGVVLPQGAISGFAGAATGTYLQITLPDGTDAKIQLFDVS